MMANKVIDASRFLAFFLARCVKLDPSKTRTAILAQEFMTFLLVGYPSFS
ncbi:hypothetical protein SAMN02982997_02799 [Legionella micdadei]|uniref:Uncharacterized protein n=1 Tax=Legionella micdadei TaxID=451 RepID=A0A1G5IIN5_LEGMI|nr:hypothetical protein SAMN02982997_02799 [Legionella micdadei]